jgi:hypothetical protein
MPQDQTAASWIDPWANQQFEVHTIATGFAGSAIRCPAVDAAQLERTLADSLRRGLFAVSAPRPVANAEPMPLIDS